MHDLQIVLFSLLLGTSRLSRGQSTTWATFIINIVIFVIMNDICCVIHFRFFTVTVSLGSSCKDQGIQRGMERKRKKFSDQDKEGELSFSYQSLVAVPPLSLKLGVCFLESL